MGDIFDRLTGESTLTEKAQNVARMIGIMLIVTIQLVGPPMIFCSRVFGIGVLDKRAYHWECCPWHWRFDRKGDYTCLYADTPAAEVSYFDDWHHVVTTK